MNDLRDMMCSDSKTIHYKANQIRHLELTGILQLLQSVLVLGGFLFFSFFQKFVLFFWEIKWVMSLHEDLFLSFIAMYEERLWWTPGLMLYKDKLTTTNFLLCFFWAWKFL